MVIRRVKEDDGPLLREIAIRMYSDRSVGKCCAQPAYISLGISYIKRPSRNTTNLSNQLVR